jgi:hypothetical protein
MTSFKLFGAALLLSAFVAVPVSAQQAIDEPGAYSFYHPNADVLNGGAPTPAAAMASRQPRDAMASTQMSVRPHRAAHITIKRY